MSLLSLCQNAADETGLSRPASIIGSSDQVAIRCLRYAVRTGRELVRANVAYLIKENTFSTVASQEAYSMPNDFDHFVPFTNWNRTTSRRMFPIGSNDWQELKSGLVTASINDRFRIRGQNRDFIIDPTPASVETVSFEYVSKNYAQTQAGTGLSAWASDTDTGVMDEEIFELGLIWRLLNRMGLAYQEEKAEYQIALNQAIAQILPQKVSTDGYIPTASNLPDASFPS